MTEPAAAGAPPSEPPSVARRIVRSHVVRQVALFTLSNGLVGLLGAVSKALLARALSVVAFGALSFAVSLIQFTSLLFEFGLFVPASRLTARAKDEHERRVLIGTALLAYIPVGLAFCATMVGLSFAIDPLFKVDAGDALLLSAPLAFAYPFSLIGLQLSQGVDRLHVYSITSALSGAIFVGALLAVSAADLGLSAGSALALKSAGVLVGGLVLAAWLRPIFHGARQYLPVLVQQAREWGFKVYVGRVLSIGTYNLDVLILGALTDAESVGFYTLAGAIAYGVGLPVTGLASTIFPRMARGDRLKREWLAIAWGSGIASIIGAWFLAEPVIGWVFSDAYKPAAALVVPLVVGQTIRGVTSIYNSYFSAHALGNELRDANIVLTVSNLILNFVLIPPFGATGAAWASVLALAANFAAHLYGYRRSIRSTTPESSSDIT